LGNLESGLGLNRYSDKDLCGLISDIFEATGSKPTEAGIVAAHLVEASLFGHDSHGILRAAKYVDWLSEGHINLNQHAKVVVDTGPVMSVDGGFGYGQVIGLEAMEMLAERAEKYGVACMSIQNSAHLGRIGKWAEILADRGLVSVHFVNTTGFGILVAPFGGSDRRLSANPIAAGSPRKNGPPIILDFATSKIAEGKVQVARNRGITLPENTVLGGNGRETTDPEVYYGDPPGAILPFAGHKGYGISVFCEIMAGAATAAGCSNPNNETAGKLVNNQLSIAINPRAFGPISNFEAEVADLEEWVKASPPLDPDAPVLFPGDIERRTYEDRIVNGIPLDENTVGQLLTAARSLGLDL
jgi:hydroxycarboxylate dehydrogenase B